MLDKDEIPSNKLVVRVVLYLMAVIALGMSFSFTLGLLNTAFEIGAVGTLVNVFLSLLFARHVASKHFTSQNS